MSVQTSAGWSQPPLIPRNPGPTGCRAPCASGPIYTRIPSICEIWIGSVQCTPGCSCMTEQSNSSTLWCDGTVCVPSPHPTRNLKCSLYSTAIIGAVTQTPSIPLSTQSLIYHTYYVYTCRHRKPGDHVLVPLAVVNGTSRWMSTRSTCGIAPSTTPAT